MQKEIRNVQQHDPLISHRRDFLGRASGGLGLAALATLLNADSLVAKPTPQTGTWS